MSQIKTFILGNDSMSYPNQLPFLERWEPENTAAKSLLSAVLTTIISFQVTTIVFEIAFGFKTRGRARLRDLHLKLLANEASPLKAADSILRCDWFTRFTRVRDVSARSEIERDRRRIQFSTTFKLVLLIMVGPIANIAAVILSLERDKVYKFEDLGVEQLQLGFTDQKLIVAGELTADCSLQKIELLEMDEAVTNLLLCRSAFLQAAGEDPNTSPNFQITVSFYKDFSINLLIQSESKNLDWQLYGLMLVKEGRFRVSPSFRPKDLKRFANICKRLLEEKCNSDNPENGTSSDAVTRNLNPYIKSLQPVNTINQRTRHQFTTRQASPGIDDPGIEDGNEPAGPTLVVMDTRVEVKCKRHISADTFIQTADEIRDRVRFVNGSTFTVVKEEVIEEFANTKNEDKIYKNREKGQKLTLLIRRTSNVGLLILAVLAGCILIIRTLAHFICHDDLLFGLENVLREHFDVGRMDSMLQNDDPVDLDQPARVRRRAYDDNDPEDYDSEPGR